MRGGLARPRAARFSPPPPSIQPSPLPDPPPRTRARSACTSLTPSPPPPLSLSPPPPVLTSPDVPLLLSRTLITSFAAALPGLPPPARKAAAAAALDRLDARAATFTEAAAALRVQLSEAAAAEEDWAAAAAALAGVDADSAGLRWPPARRLGHAVRVAMLYLEADDPGAADAYVKRAAGLVAEVKVRGKESRAATAARTGAHPLHPQNSRPSLSLSLSPHSVRTSASSSSTAPAPPAS